MFGKLVLGPLIDRARFPSYGLRRPWIIIAQLGMIVTMGTFPTLDDPLADGNLESGPTIMLFFLIHNIFPLRCKMSSDALAGPHSRRRPGPCEWFHVRFGKGFGFMFAAIALGGILSASGFQAALTVQLPVLTAIMMGITPFSFENAPTIADSHGIPIREVTSSAEVDTMSFGDIVTGLRSALSGGAPAWALLFAAMMWIGGGMGAGMGMIDHSSPSCLSKNWNWSDTEYLALKGV